METKLQQSWGDFLNPDVVRPVLVSASIYIAVFEALTDAIVNRIREFFCHGFDESGDKIDPRYQSTVLSRNKSPIYASLDWLKEMNAIDDADIDSFNCIKSCRNELAHRLLSMLASETTVPDFATRLKEMAALIRKIEVWWIKEVEIPSNPAFDGKEISEDGIVPGTLLALQLLCDIALGDEDRSRFYINEFEKRTKTNQI
jgi:hypothetical protein